MIIKTTVSARKCLTVIFAVFALVSLTTSLPVMAQQKPELVTKNVGANQPSFFLLESPKEELLAKGTLRAISVGGKNSTVVMARSDTPQIIWRSASGKDTGVTAMYATVRASALAPDGNLLVMGDGEILILDELGNRVRNFTIPRSTSVAGLRDGGVVISNIDGSSLFTILSPTGQTVRGIGPLKALYADDPMENRIS